MGQAQRVVDLGLERALRRNLTPLRVAVLDGHYPQRFLEQRQLMHELALAAERERCAVEDELVLAADHVDIDQRHAVLGDAFAHHVVTRMLLAHMIGRGIEHQQHLGAGRARRPRRHRRP